MNSEGWVTFRYDEGGVSYLGRGEKLSNDSTLSHGHVSWFLLTEDPFWDIFFILLACLNVCCDRSHVSFNDGMVKPS